MSLQGLPARLAWLTLTCACLAGCATTYRYATGQQAELLGRSGEWPWYAWHVFIAPGAPSTDPGVSYEIATGQTEAAVQAQLGRPSSITPDPQRRGDDAWDYPFATIRFRNGRVNEVRFQEQAGGTRYYERHPRLSW